MNGSSEKPLFLNVYEYTTYESLDNSTEDDCRNDDYIFEDLLFECQCILYLIDLNSKESLEYIKVKDKLISSEEYPYAGKIIVITKKDITNNNEITLKEVNEFANQANISKIISISLKTEENYSQLIDMIYSNLYENKFELAINFVGYISKTKKQYTEKNSKQIRIILLGDPSVGKTSFVQRYFKNEFSVNMMMTVGVSDESKFLIIEDAYYLLRLWDTAGQEKYNCLPKNYYQNADGIFLLFDVCERKTFEGIAGWMKNISDKMATTDKKSKKYPVMYLLGNKVDSPKRVVKKEEAEQAAKPFKVDYFEVSAKLNLNIFETISKMSLAISKKLYGSSQEVNLSKKSKPSEKCC